MLFDSSNSHGLQIVKRLKTKKKKDKTEYKWWWVNKSKWEQRKKKKHGFNFICQRLLDSLAGRGEGRENPEARLSYREGVLLGSQWMTFNQRNLVYINSVQADTRGNKRSLNQTNPIYQLFVPLIKNIIAGKGLLPCCSNEEAILWEIIFSVAPFG